MDEEDDIDLSVPILQELEIDFQRIWRTVVWTVLYPWSSLCSRNSLGETPFSEKSHEFWGPCLVVLMYGLVLLWGHFQDIPWVVMIWFVASLFLHLVVRLRRPRVKLALSLAVIGYSVLPLIVVAIVVLAHGSRGLLLSAIQAVGVFWSSRSAYLSYCRSLNLTWENKPLMLLLPIVLAEVYFTSLMSG